jgi:hypothetical protein
METADSPNDSTDSFDWRPDRLIRRWLWVAAGGVAGALLALVLSACLAPIYEASASLALGIDYPRTAPLDELSEIRVLDRVAALVTSDATLALVAQELQDRHGSQAAWSSAAELRKHTRLDRKAAWDFVGIAEDPEDSARIANAWMDVSRSEINEAMDHAWQTLRLQSAVIVLACSEMSEGASSDFFWECLATGPVLDEAQVEALRQELEQSRGVTPIISYEPVQAAVADTSPVVWDRAPLVAGGALAGMVVGAVLALAVPRRPTAARSARGTDDPEGERLR